MKILILNAGSSSLKYQLMDMDGEIILAKGMVDRIGIPGSAIKQTAGEQVFTLKTAIPKHTDAIHLMLKALMDPEKGAIKSLDEIGAFGHRVVNGGEKFTDSILVTDEVKATIREYFTLAPLHNPPNLMGIEACEEAMPGIPSVAVFDTSFHQSMAKEAYLYGIPLEYYDRLKLRRYGFHGTSHRYVTKRVCEYLGIPVEGSRIITCHLGNGSSLAAVKDGKCMDTSMGLTPLEGVIMGTRSGNLDPAVVQFIANSDDMTVDEVISMCNKKAGLIGISGISSDMRDIDAEAEKGNKRAILAQDMLSHSIRKYIGAYAAVMGGVDVIVFTAGIGENNAHIRAKIMQGFEYLGAKLDLEKNKTREEAVISTDDSKVKICVIPTNEELVIARDTLAIVTG